MDSFSLVIFGITSNLAQIKLLPALYDMEMSGALPEGAQIIGSARSPMSDEEFKEYLSETIMADNRHHQHSINETVVKKLLGRFHYLNGNLDDPEYYSQLKAYLGKLGIDNHIFYLATYPDLYQGIFENLQAAGMNKQDSGWVRLMIEKPIGHDAASAKALNELLVKYFDESQIFRLDHYLGKETLQNILTFRFGNEIFEPMINKENIDHIQITAAENFGIGKRGGYYDTVGALKDVGQNHQLQMIALATMDAPMEFSNEAVTAERVKVLESLVPGKVVFGQYRGYQQEANVAADSTTDTYYAFKAELNNERFRGVPIYVRAGKMLPETVTEIAIVFKTPVNRLFKQMDCGDEPNVLIYRIQPNEGIVFKILTKKPGQELKLEPEFMQYCYRGEEGGHTLPDPYDRLIRDVIAGDQTFFNDAAEVEAEWKFTEPLSAQRQVPSEYEPGSWGPKEGDELLEADGRHWLVPSMDFCRIG